jgi:hypothetical protein
VGDTGCWTFLRTGGGATARAKVGMVLAEYGELVPLQERYPRPDILGGFDPTTADEIGVGLGIELDGGEAEL